MGGQPSSVIGNDINWTKMEKKKKNFWQAIGLTAAALNIATFIPPIIQIIVEPNHQTGAQFAIPLYVLVLVNNFFWLPYGLAIHSLALIITAVLNMALAIIFIAMTYTLPDKTPSSNDESSNDD